MALENYLGIGDFGGILDYMPETNTNLEDRMGLKEGFRKLFGWAGAGIMFTNLFGPAVLKGHTEEIAIAKNNHEIKNIPTISRSGEDIQRNNNQFLAENGVMTANNNKLKIGQDNLTTNNGTMKIGEDNLTARNGVMTIEEFNESMKGLTYKTETDFNQIQIPNEYNTPENITLKKIMEEGTPADNTLKFATQRYIEKDYVSAFHILRPIPANVSGGIGVPEDIPATDARYWTLLKLVDIELGKINSNAEYTATLLGKNEIIPPKKGSPIWHYAVSIGYKGHVKSFNGNEYRNWTQSTHATYSLVGGITGNTNDATPLLTGSYKQIPEVKKLSKKIENLVPNYTEEDKLILSYLVTEIKNNKTLNNPTLTALCLGNKGQENPNLYLGFLAHNLRNKKTIPDIYQDEGDYLRFKLKTS